MDSVTTPAVAPNGRSGLFLPSQTASQDAKSSERSRGTVTPPTDVRTTWGRLTRLRTALLEGLVERDLQVRLALLAAIAGEHVLLVGPPGTAKSLVAQRLHRVFEGAPYFERLLTRFSVPEELFGPLSVRALEEDRYERQTTGYLPAAGVAFLDEVFKANSAILNALLTLLNERQFDNGSARTECPLVTVVAASNELPKGEELDALFDRFLIRVHVGPVSAGGFEQLVSGQVGPEPIVRNGDRLTLTELREFRELSQLVTLPRNVVDLLADLRNVCTANGIFVSDRRFRKMANLLRAIAYVHGRDEVSIWDAWVLPHCAWNAPEQLPLLQDWYARKVGATTAMNPTRLAKVVTAREATLDRDRKILAQATDSHGRLLFDDPRGEPTTLDAEPRPMLRGSEKVYRAPAGAVTQQNYHHYQPISDTTNRGTGFTAAELGQLFIVKPDGTRVEFERWIESNKYLANSANAMTETVRNKPRLEPQRYSDAHVEGTLVQVNREIDDARAALRFVEDQLATLHDQVASHLFITPDFRDVADQSLREVVAQTRALVGRLETVRAGVVALPRIGVADVEVVS